MNGRVVWVTGLGAVTGAGVGTAPLLDALRAGRSAVRPLPELDGLLAVPAPDPPRDRRARHLERSAALFFAAAEEAWRDAGLGDDVPDPARYGVIEGSSLGPLADALETLRTRLATGDGILRPSGLVRFMTGAGGAALAHSHRLRGPVLHVSAGSVSAACAIGEGFQKIAAGLADVVVAGGAECPLQRDVIEHFRLAGILATPGNGDVACRPFDARRAGTVLGEGAGVLVLEDAGHAARRGARPRAVVSGFGLTCEAFSMISPEPGGAGVAESVRAALGAHSPDSIGWIKAHGTGTRLNDAAEVRGIASVFGTRLTEVPLTSLKPALGHALGASGAVEAVAGLLALEGGFVPPTLGTERADPELPPCRIALTAEPSDAREALFLSESFGGRCAALAVRRPAAA
jgi:3-oxoacyl-[acyl-carrier-protein] synthase II